MLIAGYNFSIFYCKRTVTMERCMFCGWTRKSALPAIRFFGIPKEPGMRRMQWLYALGKKDITPRDRVCSVHFRRGRPTTDPSHEDFAPHLYLNKEPPAEVLAYLENLAESKPSETKEGKYKTSLAMLTPTTMELNKAPRPSILQRKRPNVVVEELNSPLVKPTTEEISSSSPSSSSTLGTRRLKLQILQKPLAQAAGVRPGQMVIIKRKASRKEDH